MHSQGTFEPVRIKSRTMPETTTASPSDLAPLMSIAIISHKRPVLCQRAVASVLQATKNYARDCYIHVYDSTPAPLQMQDCRVQVHHCPEMPSALAKRRLAGQEAQGEWLVLMDDDCRMQLHALRVLDQAIARARPETAIFVCNTRFVGSKRYWFRCLEKTDYFTDFHQCTNESPVPWGPTSLSAFRVNHLMTHGAFDAQMPILAGGEDVNACLTLREKGLTIIGLPHELVDHTTETWNYLRANAWRAFHYGQGNTELCRLWPNKRLLDFTSPLVLLLATLTSWLGVALYTTAITSTLLFPVLFAVLGFGTLWTKEALRYPDKQLLHVAGLCIIRLCFATGHLERQIVRPSLGIGIHRFDWDWAWSLTGERGVVFGTTHVLPWLVMLASVAMCLTLS